MKKTSSRGFTLVEMIIVVVILSSILLLLTTYSTRKSSQLNRAKAALTMQQILNAAQAYYIDYGQWPLPGGIGVGDTYTLQLKKYLPAGSLVSAGNPLGQYPNPWGLLWGTYSYMLSASPSTFTVYTTTPSDSEAKVLAGMLILGKAVAGARVYSSIPIPAHILNSARSVNFTGIFNHGACVPVPDCPGSMIAQIMTAPVGVRGVTDAPTTDGTNACTSSTVYNADGTTAAAGNCAQINSYALTGYSTMATSATTVDGAGGGPPTCYNPSVPATCYANTDSSGALTQVTTGKKYWRVCLQIQTENGPVSFNNQAGAAPVSGQARNQNLYWTQSMGQIMAITRCAPPNEPAGSSLNVWGN